jgi:hypothetical protein
MRMSTLRSVLAVGAAAVAAAVAASAMADSSEPPPSPSASSPEPTPLPLERPIATRVDPRLVAQTQAFARAAAPRDTLPARARGRLTAIPSLGANADLARFVRTGPDGESYYYVAGTDSIALVNQSGSGMIDDIDHAFSGDSVGTQDCAGDGSRLRVVGILPGRAEDPVIRLSDGSAVPVKHVDLVYVAVFPKVQEKLPVSVEWTLDGRRMSTTVPVPSDILTGSCGPPAAP